MPAYYRWTAALDKASVPHIHAPQRAAQNAAAGVDITGRIKRTLDQLDEWLPRAEAEVTEAGGQNWTAMLRIIREAREQTKLYADLLERVYDIEQVQAFQEHVLAAVQEADPETAERIRESLRRRHDIRRAALLGV